MLAVLLAAALAADPVVDKPGDSWIVSHIDLEASPEEVFALMKDHATLSSFNSTTRVEQAPDGACTRLTTHVDHPLAKTTYVTRACPDGERALKQTLVSGDMEFFESRTWVEVRGETTRLHHKIKTIPKMAVPQFFVDGAAAKGARKLLEAIRDHLAASP